MHRYKCNLCLSLFYVIKSNFFVVITLNKAQALTISILLEFPRHFQSLTSEITCIAHVTSEMDCKSSALSICIRSARVLRAT